MSIRLICGFECGSDNDASPVHFAGVEYSTSTVRSGLRSLRINATAATTPGSITNLIEETVVGRFYIRFASLPDDDTYLAVCGINEHAVGVAFQASDDTIRCATGGVGGLAPSEFGATGDTPELNTWYRIDFKIVQTSGAKSANATITKDDGEENIVTLAEASSEDTWPIAAFTVGTQNYITRRVTAEWFYDDCQLADDAADYPIGPGYVNFFIPVADGTHNIAGANQFERGDTGVDITNATTTAYQLVDDVPVPPELDLTTDYIAAVAPASADDYVEVKFGPGPGISVPSDPPSAIDVIVAHHQAGASVGNIRLALVDNGSTDDVLNLTGLGVSDSVRFTQKIYVNPPSPASSWNVNGDGGDGDFLNVRMRFYSSDAEPPDQYWDSAMIEAEFPPTEAPNPPGGYYACAGTLPTFQTADQDKIDALRALRAAGEKYGPVFELVKVEWPSPDGTIYYAVMKTDEVSDPAPPVSPIEARLKPDGYPAWFLPVEIDSAIGDEEVDLEFWDGDGAISDLLADHGEGIRTTLYYWFPVVELMLPIWHGHLRQEDEAEIDICRVKAVQGFRSSDAVLPRRAHWRECQAIFGGVFDTQEEIDEGDCPYNKHIGGSVGNFETGSTPYTSCPRRTIADCNARLGNSGNFMLSHATQSITVSNNQTKGPRLFSTSEGNETNLKDPVRVVMGTRRVYEMPVVVSRKDYNNNNPENGFIFLITEAGEGPVDQLSYPIINFGSDDAPADPFNFNYRLGEKGQSPVDTALTTFGYSSTALIRARSPWVDPANVDVSGINGSVVVRGLNNIRVYTDAETYTEQYTDNRAWHIMEMLTNKRWGYGYDYDRLDIPAFIEAACWCANVVRFTDDNGDTWDHIRALSHVELRGRKVQQQIEDMCLAGRLSRPFLFNGKIHIVPLRALTTAELAAAPVFTDEGTTGRNIIWEDGKPTLKRTRTSDLELANRIECTFDDAEEDYLERPVRPVEDIDAQLAAGRVVGDHSRKINVKKYGLAGVVVEGQAIKMATALRDLGPHDEGGLQNNLRLPFKIWFIDSLDLYPTKVIKVQSSQITRYGFDYFRVMKMKRLGNLHVELEVQAYNVAYMDAFEYLYGSIDPIPTDPDTPPAGSVAPPTDPLAYTSVSYSSGTLSITSEAS